MDKFRVEVIAQTPNPQTVIYAAMHQDYSDQFIIDERDQWPSETKCGEIIVKRLLAGERGHYGPLEHVQIVFNCGYFPHSVMQQARTHRVGISFDVQSFRYTGQQFIEVLEGKKEAWKNFIGPIINEQKEFLEASLKQADEGDVHDFKEFIEPYL
jgi:thymidylate synthase (FAD)